METVSTTYPGMNIESVDYHDPFYHATVATDYPRSADKYVYDRTQNGRFFIREYNSSQSDIEADYVVTHFSLDAPEHRVNIYFLTAISLTAVSTHSR